jgi:hypothetical protein
VFDGWHKDDGKLQRGYTMKRFLIAVFIILVGLSACTSDPRARLEKEIVGNWVSSDGFSIQFSSDGGGFIPGVEGKIPDSQFVYTVNDGTHVSINLGGQTFNIEILIDGDNLTWKDNLGEVKYTRAK